MKQFRVYEENTMLLETDDRTEAGDCQRNAHRKDPTKFHEVYRLNSEGKYDGIDQFSPHDCPECRQRPKNCKCKQKQIMNIFQQQLPIVIQCEKRGIFDAENACVWKPFWFWVSWSCPDVSCPNCGSYNRYQDPRALAIGYSVFVCRECDHREFDD